MNLLPTKNSERFIVFSLVMLMSSVYLFPGYTNNIFYYLFFISLYFTYRCMNIETLSNSMVLLIIALICYTSLSTTWAQDSGRYAFEVLKDGMYLLVALFVVIGATKRLGTNYVVDVVISTAMVSGVMVVAATILLAPSAVAQAFSTPERLTHWSFVGMANNPIHSGFFVGLSTLFSIHFFRSTASRWRSILLLVIIIGLASFVLLTKSRGAIAFLAVSVVLLLTLIRPTNRSRDFELLFIAAISIFVVLVFKPDMVLSRIGGGSIRIDILNEYSKMYLSSPLFGVGWSEDMPIITQAGITFSKPHNSFFHVLLATGLPGIAIFATLTLYPLYFAVSSGQSRTILVGLWFLFGCLYIAVDGRYPVRQPAAQWLYYWIPLYLLISKILEEKSGNIKK